MEASGGMFTYGDIIFKHKMAIREAVYAACYFPSGAFAGTELLQ